jgi:hypothetical protein
VINRAIRLDLDGIALLINEAGSVAMRRAAT